MGEAAIRESFRQIFARSQGLDAFFGVPLAQVNVLIQQIAIERQPVPEWLRGIRQIRDLPRYVGPDFDMHYVSGATLTTPQIAERIAWIVEEISGPWTICEDGFGFVDEIEQIHYAMQFGV